jgi:hypothetical protein
MNSSEKKQVMQDFEIHFNGEFMNISEINNP